MFYDAFNKYKEAISNSRHFIQIDYFDYTHLLCITCSLSGSDLCCHALNSSVFTQKVCMMIIIALKHSNIRHLLVQVEFLLVCIHSTVSLAY